MDTEFKIRNRIVILRLIFYFVLILLLSSPASGQTELGPPYTNPAGNTLLIDDWRINSNSYRNEGMIKGILDADWYLLNLSGAFFQNAGTVDIWRSIGSVEFFGGFLNAGTVNNEITGTINNYGLFTNSSVYSPVPAVVNNHGQINNYAEINASSGNFENYGTIVNYPYTHTPPSSSGLLILSSVSNDLGSFSSTFNNYGDIINKDGSSGIDIEQYSDDEGDYTPAEITLNNYGTITNEERLIPSPTGYTFGTNQLTNFTLHNHGSFDNQAGNITDLSTEKSLFYNESTGYISNAGMMRLYGFANAGLVHNTGTFYDDIMIDESGSSYVISNTGTIINDGTWVNGSIYINGGIIENNGTFDNTSNIFYEDTFVGNISNGIIKGTGTFIGNLKTGIGTVAPGNSAGTMIIDGDYTLADYTGDPDFGDGSGTLEIEIGGFDLDSFGIPVDSDFLDITGTAFLTGGTIEFSFLSGYDISTDVLPGQTEYLKFLEADGGIFQDDLSTVDGFASTITYDFLGTPDGFTYDVYQQDNSLIFSATNNNVVPVPGAIILGCIGVGCVTRLRRRGKI